MFVEKLELAPGKEFAEVLREARARAAVRAPTIDGEIVSIPKSVMTPIQAGARAHDAPTKDRKE